MTADRSARGRASKARGKAVERVVARLYGGQRMPDTGAHWADVQTVSACIEVKSRQTPTPALIRGAWDQAETAARATGKEPLVVLSFVDGGRRTYWEVRRLSGPEDLPAKASTDALYAGCPVGQTDGLGDREQAP